MSSYDLPVSGQVKSVTSCVDGAISSTAGSLNVEKGCPSDDWTRRIAINPSGPEKETK